MCCFDFVWHLGGKHQHISVKMCLSKWHWQLCLQNKTERAQRNNAGPICKSTQIFVILKNRISSLPVSRTKVNIFQITRRPYEKIHKKEDFSENSLNYHVREEARLSLLKHSHSNVADWFSDSGMVFQQQTSSLFSFTRLTECATLLCFGNSSELFFIIDAF